jgi:hypothetical protein
VEEAAEDLDAEDFDAEEAREEAKVRFKKVSIS